MSFKASHIIGSLTSVAIPMTQARVFTTANYTTTVAAHTAFTKSTILAHVLVANKT
jgi:hypothetical protein